jgi:hypothetical protein
MAEQDQRNVLHEKETQVQQAMHQKDLLSAIQQASVYTQEDAQTRADLLKRIDALLTENKFRNEQMVHLLGLNATTSSPVKN